MPTPPALAVLLAALLSAFSLQLPGAAFAQTSGSTFGIALPAHSYYIVTRIDPRLCPSSICGGVYVKQVNQSLTVCTDGTLAAECYAPILDWSALRLSQEETWQLEDDFRRELVLARGTLRIVDTPFGPLAALVATDAWRGVTGSDPTGRFFGLRSSGIVCFTYPCPELLSVWLNQRRRELVHGLDLTASGADAKQLDEGYTALYQGAGLLVSGYRRLITGPAGRGIQIVAREFYTKVASAAGGSCSGTDPLPPPGDFCPTVYDPVCGCDGISYGNDCERVNAQVRLAHPGACAP